ncbi:MAG: hypothetical protein WBW72_02340 [Erwinia billingiae]
MKIEVTFDDSGIKEEHDFNFEPRAGDSVTLVRNGKKTQYEILTVSGPIHGQDCHPSMARVRPA